MCIHGNLCIYALNLFLSHYYPAVHMKSTYKKVQKIRVPPQRQETVQFSTGAFLSEGTEDTGLLLPSSGKNHYNDVKKQFTTLQTLSFRYPKTSNNS